MKTEDVAKIAHEAIKTLCETQGDFTQQTWNNAPDWQRTSAINGVNFHLENSHTGPDDSHNAWLKEKEADGWKYGAVKDPEKKEHPCMVKYSDLPASQQAKDYLFRGIVHALAPFVQHSVGTTA